MMGHVPLTRISSKLPAARSLPRPSRDCRRCAPKTSDVMDCQTTSCHDSTCGAVCLQYCVKVLRHSNFHSVPFCRTCGKSVCSRKKSMCSRKKDFAVDKNVCSRIKTHLIEVPQGRRMAGQIWRLWSASTRSAGRACLEATTRGTCAARLQSGGLPTP